MRPIFLCMILFLVGVVLLNSSCRDACSPTGRYLVVSTYAGMGNRLRVIASSQIMAAITDRQLVIDWQYQANEMVGEYGDFFTTPLVLFKDSALARAGCTMNAITSASANDASIKNLGVQNSVEAIKTIQQIPQFNEPIVYFGSAINYSPLEQDMPREEYRKAYRRYYHNLTPVTAIRNEVKNFKKENHLDNYYMVGVHYRAWTAGPADVNYAPLINDPNQRYVEDFAKEMRKALALPASETGGKPVAFYLSTDNVDARQKLLAYPEFNGKIFYRTAEIERLTIEGQRSAMVDFFLLGSTVYVMGTLNSSFSDEAAFLTERDKIDIGKSAYR